KKSVDLPVEGWGGDVNHGDDQDLRIVPIAREPMSSRAKPEGRVFEKLHRPRSCPRLLCLPCNDEIRQIAKYAGAIGKEAKRFVCVVNQVPCALFRARKAEQIDIGRFAGVLVLLRCLAEFLGRGLNVENVIDDLEGE